VSPVPACDLLVLGDCNPDLVVSGGDIKPVFGQVEQLVGSATMVIGGSGAITACGAARLGVRAGLISLVGDDQLGRFMLEAVAATGVDVSGCAVDGELPTGVTVVLTRGDDRAILTAAGTIAALAAEHVDRIRLGRVRHLHVSAYFLQTALQPGLGELLAAARDAGATTSLDPNWDPAGRWDSGLAELLPLVGFLLCNEQEAAALGGAERLAGSGSTVVVKRGPRGAWLLEGGRTLEAEAPAVEVVDATGAGDSFDAGFIAGLLAGRDLQQCLRLACVCGALSTRAAGGTAGQPTLDVADAQR
jgi:sugar/nucleoside kinase (ribokinase family)